MEYRECKKGVTCAFDCVVCTMPPCKSDNKNPAVKYDKKIKAEIVKRGYLFPP